MTRSGQTPASASISWAPNEPERTNTSVSLDQLGPE
jgi:hypothetical protein